MFGVTTSDDYKPVTYVGRYPVDVTTLLVGVHIVCAVCTALLLAARTGFLDLLLFDNAYVLQAFQFWRLATYAFVHAPGSLLWFAIEMYMLFSFGRDVERFIGRRAFITLYLLLLFVPVILLTLGGAWMRLGYSGSSALHFGIFLAFAAIYPRVEMFMLRIQVKWIAFILLAIFTLAALAAHDWSSLVVLWSTALASYLFIRARGVGDDPHWLADLKEKFQRKPKFRVLPQAAPRRTVETEDIDAMIDPLLEKISKSGINSLTAQERRTLDQARAQLLKKDA